MRDLLVLVVVAVVSACGGGNLQTVQLVNHTNRAIDEIYVYAPGAAEHGASRGSLAPNATTQVKVKQGAIEILAVSAKIVIDATTRDKPSASQAIEVRGPTEVVFYDLDHKPAGLGRPGVYGIAFVLPKPAAEPVDATEPVPPAPE